MQLIPRHDPYLAVRSTGSVTVAALRGELDLVLVRHLRPELDALVRESDALTVDIRRLDFCDATGLGLLAQCAGRTRRRGARWRLLCDQPRILRLIRLTALGDVLCPESDSAGAFPVVWEEGSAAPLPAVGAPRWERAGPRWEQAGPRPCHPGATRPLP
ncbi:STAS domain-containing protein [Streptomyces sp. NPDC127584]|uniref:STAS domain-containing protein n=1 Tax=Streptomyces sp. NPDC127584 TaxID=3345403 RepID=UPI00363E1B18